MGLIHWWPLNNDTQDRITNTQLTNNGATIVNNGKTGQCYTFNGSTNLTTSYPALNTLGSNPAQFSFAFWIKLNSTWTGWGQVFTIGRNGSSWTDIRIGFDIASDKTGYFTTSDGTTTTSYGGPKHTLTIGKWYHIVATFDNKEMKLFIDGQPASTPRATASVLPSLSSDTIIAIGGNSGEKGECDINDVRIYDHALSQAEVKELSKALVVHYTFNDVCAEPTTNVSTINGWGSYTSYFVISERTETGLKVYRPTNSTNTVLALSNSAVTGKMAAGEIWTFSCYLYIDGKPYKCTQPDMSTYQYSGINYYSNDDGYYTCTFTVGTPEAWIIHAPMFGSVGTNVMCEIDKIQFEKKDHATPYTPTSRESMLVNEAGYGGNGTLYNSNLSIDTASGTLSCHTPRINPNSINTMVNTTNSAYVYADVFGYNHTPTEFTVAWWWKVIDWGYGIGPFGLVTSNGNYMDSTLGVHDGAVYVNFAGGNTRVSRGFTGGGTGKWTHFAITFKPGSYTSYINGVSQGTATTDASLTLDPWRYLYLGAGCAGGCLRDGNIYWGDFRYYNTCLSANDIAELYKTKAYITDQGDIEAHQFIEDKTQAQVTHKYTFECKETQEKPNIPGFELLDGILIEKNPYFDTGLVFSDVNTSIYVDAEVTPTNTSGNNCLAGSGNSGWNGPIMLNFCGGKMEFGTSGYSTSTEPQGKFAVNERLTVQAEIYLSTQKWYKNNVQINNITQRTRTTTTATFAIGTFKTPSGTVGASHSFKGYIHRFYVKYGDEVRCYLPAKRKSDNVYGLYDIHTKTFLVNSGGGSVSGTVSTLCDEAAIYHNGHISGREIIEI
jgi:hypothetical protein